MRLTGTWPAACLVVALAGTTLGAQNKTANFDHREWVRRVDFGATVTTTSYLVYPGTEGYDEGCAGRPMTTMVGAGTSSLLGVLWVRQSHCLGALESPVEGPGVIPLAGGRFEFVDARGKTVLGQYRGRLVATPNAGMGEVVPYGAWLIQGAACVSGGTRYPRIVDDCAADKYAPVRGAMNLNSLEATLFLDQTIGLAYGRD
jgi:hypothetical protein